MNNEELGKILDGHRLWLSSEKKDGYFADLIGVDLRGTTALMGANLTSADLSGVTLRHSDVSNANLTDVKMSNADLSWADLSDSILCEANLNGTNLSDTDLTGADLTGAYLINADLGNADLSGADLSGVTLRNANNIVSFQCGKTNRVSYAVRHKDCIMFQIGCLWGTSEEVIKKIRKDYGENSHYERLVSLYTEEEFWIENGHREIR